MTLPRAMASCGTARLVNRLLVVVLNYLFIHSDDKRVARSLVLRPSAERVMLAVVHQRGALRSRRRRRDRSARPRCCAYTRLGGENKTSRESLETPNRVSAASGPFWDDRVCVLKRHFLFRHVARGNFQQVAHAKAIAHETLAQKNVGSVRQRTRFLRRRGRPPAPTRPCSRPGGCAFVSRAPRSRERGHRSLSFLLSGPLAPRAKPYSPWGNSAF